MENAGGAFTILHSPLSILHLDLLWGGISTELTAARAEAGFVVTRVGTNEVFSFAKPDNAVVLRDWADDGAFGDGLWRRLSPPRWEFPFGGQTVTNLTLVADGTLRPDLVSTGTVFKVFAGPLALVPESRWSEVPPVGLSTDAVSRAWWALTPSNSLVCTLNGALLNRETNLPVNVQAEFFDDGRFVYRYDLSALGRPVAGEREDRASLTNLFQVGAWRNGLGEGYTFALPQLQALTSVSFCPFRSEDLAEPDLDGDGLTTWEELFVHGTDPHSPDTDGDGLSDYEEVSSSGLFCPLDPYSGGGPLSDGTAKALGDLQPFASAQEGGPSFYACVVYSGTTNGVVSLPEADAETAVLDVTVSGAGTADLVLRGLGVESPQVEATGVRVVPLLGEAGRTTTLHVAVPRGVRVQMALRRSFLAAAPSVSFDSANFAYGELPQGASPWGTKGWIVFPRTLVPTACIHDLQGRTVEVSLDPGPEVEGLSCSWVWDGVFSPTPRSDLTTLLKADMPATETRVASYFLRHSQYLFGEESYGHLVRFCPNSSDPDESVPGGGDAQSHSFDDVLAGVRAVDVGRCPCREYGCPGFRCSCPCHGEEGPFSTNRFDAAEACEEYTNAFHNAGYAEIANVIRLHETPESYVPVHLYVPTGRVEGCTCNCPTHNTNNVELIYCSPRLAVRRADGTPFRRSTETCAVRIVGVSPSVEIGDATAAFSRNGKVFLRRDCTVLGLVVEHPTYDLKEVNSLDPERTFGFPMVVTTNVDDAVQLFLRNDVGLASGVVHLGIECTNGAFRVWRDLPDLSHELLLDTEGRAEVSLTMADWRRLVGVSGNGSVLPVRLTASVPGSCRLVFRYGHAYADGDGGHCVTAQAEQVVTAVEPPLLPDYDGDGRIDAADRAAFLDGRLFRYWTNDDTVKGDYLGQIEDARPNAEDLRVNGAFDLVNFFPLAYDISPFLRHWGATWMTYSLEPSSPCELHVCSFNLPEELAGTYQTNLVTTAEGDMMTNAVLTAVDAWSPYPLPPEASGEVADGRGVLAAEAANSCLGGIDLVARIEDVEVFRFRLRVRILPVRTMYRWINMRHTSGERETRATDMEQPFNFPDEARRAKKLFFLHGANVAESDAEKWGDAIFKRLWHCGVHADFYNVDWRSDKGMTGANYQENVSNAFVVATNLAPVLSAVPGEKVVMAHSLGNMVVSSMIQDHGLQVGRYLMCNSAVPCEAFYDRDDASIRVPQLVHPEWVDYPTNAWASSWHRHFDGVAGDNRRLLGWPGRFPAVLDVAVNFYSTGDEALELVSESGIMVWSGLYTNGWDVAHHCWHKQEMFKGRAHLTRGLGGTNWAGWGFNTNLLGLNRISPEEAEGMSSADFRTNTVFQLSPALLTNPAMALLDRGSLLAQAIPALAPPTGAKDMEQRLARGLNYNLNSGDTFEGGVAKPNGWPHREQYSGRWKHSDMKDVAFFYNFMFYKLVVEKGLLK